MKFGNLYLFLVCLVICSAAMISASEELVAVRRLCRHSPSFKSSLKTPVNRWCWHTEEFPKNDVDSVGQAVDESIEGLDEFEQETIQNECKKSCILGVLTGAIAGSLVYAKDLFSEVNSRNKVLSAVAVCLTTSFVLYEASKLLFSYQWIPSARRALLMQESHYIVSKASEVPIDKCIGQSMHRLYEPKNFIAKQTSSKAWF